MFATVFESLVCLFCVYALLSMYTFGFFVTGFVLSTGFLKPRCEMFCPSVRVEVNARSFCVGLHYSCLQRLCYEEVFYVCCAEFIVILAVVIYFVKRFRKRFCGGVRFPNLRASIVFSNTCSFNPMILFSFGGGCFVFGIDLQCGFCGVFRWRWLVCGLWRDVWVAMWWVVGCRGRSCGTLGSR
jgi:hypothetical protein